MIKSPLASVDVLTCEINRPILYRVIIGRSQVDDIFDRLCQIHAISVLLEDDRGKDYLKEKCQPKCKIVLSDGSSYEESSTRILDRIKTDKDRQITEIQLNSRYGPMSGSIRFDADSSFRSCYISVEGPEDKSLLYARDFVQIVSENRDITYYASRVSGFLYAVCISLCIELKFLIKYIPEVKGEPPLPNWAAQIFVSSFFIAVLALLMTIPVYLFTNKYLRKVSFIIGSNVQQHRVSVGACKLFAFAIPIGVLGNLAYATLFG